MPLHLGTWLALALLALQGPAAIPRTWDAAEVADFELPLAVPAYTPQHVPEDYYYRLPVRPVFRSYPIYHPDREPPGQRGGRVLPGGARSTRARHRERRALGLSRPMPAPWAA